MNGETEALALLRAAGLVRAESPTITPITGGVSSDVWRVVDDGRDFVVKRSVPKLRVKADWFSDPARLRYEFLYLKTVAGIVPDAVPRLLSSDADASFLAMEFLGEGFSNWKSLLLAGEIQPAHARRAGEILGRIHAATTNNPEVKRDFDTMEFFTQLRIDAYLRATAEKQEPIVAAAIRAEADRLSQHHECLVHGDFSPKNMLVSKDRFVVLDCETACFGDPAFDLSFVLNHLFLKALYHSAQQPEVLAKLDESASSLRSAYAEAHPTASKAVESRTARLLPMLLLARVDGKSPVEYLAPAQQDHIRAFAPGVILNPVADMGKLTALWFDNLPKKSS